jgi:transcriptional regulator with XRE-family HTH domain
MDKIGKRLREERLRLKLTQKDFAAVGGVLSNAQSKYERDIRSPSAIYLAQLAGIGVDVLYVLTGKHAPHDEADFNVAFNQLPPRERRIVTDLVQCIAKRT